MSPTFEYIDQTLHCEGVPLADIAREAGAPVYVYSRAALMRNVGAYLTAAPPHTLVCYAIKANGNPAILRLLAQAGMGADVTSGGELFLARHAGFPPRRIIFSGVGKRPDEIEMALAEDIHALHVESEMELKRIAEIAAAHRHMTRIGVRVNPNIYAETHPHISTGLTAHKFGVPPETAVSMLQFAAQHPWLEPVGAAAHIGSQIVDLRPFAQAARFLADFADEMAGGGIRLAYLDVGGGLGIRYGEDWRLKTEDWILDTDPTEWVTAVAEPVQQAGYQLVMEPGRSIVGSAGLLLTQVIYTKQQGEKSFLIMDAGMNDLLRPTLYNAHHPILPVNSSSFILHPSSFDVVGPVCETGDFLAKGRPLPPTQPGDLLAVMQAGAYGFAMSSNYNGRLRPAEVLVEGDAFRLIRQRQEYAHLLDGCA